ncbi:MAG: TlpA disulfide reductase family protein [Pseudomonadota bacterium]
MRNILFAAAAVAAVLGGLYAGQLTFASDPADEGSAAGGAARAETLAAMQAQAVGQMAGLTVHDAPEALPAVTLLDPDGAEIDLSAFQGEVVLMNFWATWCAPCRREMPSIDRLAGALSDQEGFRVVAVSLDRGGPEKPAAFLEEIAASRLALYRDPSFKIARDLGLLGLPVTLVIDASGQEAARLVGHAEWDAPEAQALLRTLIAN